jgi:hypothetical protein
MEGLLNSDPHYEKWSSIVAMESIVGNPSSVGNTNQE